LKGDNEIVKLKISTKIERFHQKQIILVHKLEYGCFTMKKVDVDRRKGVFLEKKWVCIEKG